MKKIVPGGYYSYDAAGKKIWLDYSYYGVGLENIDRIRNLSKNLDLYSSSGAGKPISIANGCITHSYSGTEADSDKIQVTLKTPITNSLTELTPVDGVVTLSTDGKVLVLPTGHPYLLPKYNEFTLTEGRALPEAGTYTFTNDFETELGIKNLITPWIAIYDPAGSLIDFYLFTHRPQNLSFKRDETGTIYSLSLYPGAGAVYHGQIPFADLTLDTNSNSVPDCLEATINGSVTKFLEHYAVIVEDPQDPENPEDPDIAQLLSNDNYELMSNDNKYLYSEV